MGATFGLFWTTSQLCAFHAIKILGLSVGPAIWIGVTICVSFLWGTVVFSNPVPNVLGAAAALCLLVLGVGLAAGSSHLSAARQQRRARRLPALDAQPPQGGALEVSLAARS